MARTIQGVKIASSLSNVQRWRAVLGAVVVFWNAAAISGPAVSGDPTGVAAHPAGPGIFAPPGSPVALVRLPNGDRLNIDRQTGTATGILSNVTSQVTYETRILSVDNAGIRGFARYDETGRLFELARPVEGLSPSEVLPGTMLVGADLAGRITHILGPKGQALVLHWTAAGKLGSITTQSGYVALSPDGLAREAWVYPGLRIRARGRPATATAVPDRLKPNPLQFMSMSNNDRFVRQAFALIDANLRKIRPDRAIRDWEDYWASGRYLTEDQYYIDTIVPLGPARPIEYWGTGAPLGEYIGVQVTLFAMLQAQFAFSSLQTVSARSMPVTVAFQALRGLVHEDYMRHALSGLPEMADPDHLLLYFKKADSFTDFVFTLGDLQSVWRDAFEISVNLGDEVPKTSRILQRSRPRNLTRDTLLTDTVSVDDLRLPGSSTEMLEGQLYSVARTDSGLLLARSDFSSEAPNILQIRNYSLGSKIEIGGNAVSLDEFTVVRPPYRSYTWQERMLAFWEHAYPETMEIAVREAAKKEIVDPKEAEGSETLGTSPPPVSDPPARFVKIMTRQGDGRGGVSIDPGFSAGGGASVKGVRALLGGCGFTSGAACDIAK